MDSNDSTKCKPFVVRFKVLKWHRFSHQTFAFKRESKAVIKSRESVFFPLVFTGGWEQEPCSHLGAHSSKPPAEVLENQPAKGRQMDSMFVQMGSHGCCLPSSARYQSGKRPEVKYIASFRKESEQWPRI